MVRRKYVRNEKKIQALIKSGRGAGNGSEYLPFITVREISSHGRSHRVYGWITGRVHHFLSDIEHMHFLCFENDKTVIDIREQFRLCRESTLRIANMLGVRHPKDPSSDAWLVMTTDFVVTYQRDGYQLRKAFAMKPEAKKEQKRVKQKLKIEELYWKEQGIEFEILTEVDVPLHLKRSLNWTYSYKSLTFFKEPSEGYFRTLAEQVLNGVASAPADTALNDMCADLDHQHNFESGTHLMMARHMLARGVLVTDLNKECIWEAPVSEMTVLAHAVVNNKPTEENGRAN